MSDKDIHITHTGLSNEMLFRNAMRQEIETLKDCEALLRDMRQTLEADLRKVEHTAAAKKLDPMETFRIDNL